MIGKLVFVAVFLNLQVGLGVLQLLLDRDQLMAAADALSLIHICVRSKRDTDTFFKRFTAESFYKLLNACLLYTSRCV